MKRGEVWTIAGGADYGGKPRPVVVVQADQFDANDSITVCLFTTYSKDAPLIRITVRPTEANGLRGLSYMMVDKITTTSKTRLGAHIGRLDVRDMARFNQAAIVFLGLAEPQRARRGG